MVLRRLSGRCRARPIRFAPCYTLGSLWLRLGFRQPPPVGTQSGGWDWTERRHHLAGPLGVKLLAAMTARGWLALEAKGRAVRLTPEGAKALREGLGVSLEDEGRAAA